MSPLFMHFKKKTFFPVIHALHFNIKILSIYLMYFLIFIYDVQENLFLVEETIS